MFTVPTSSYFLLNELGGGTIDNHTAAVVTSFILTLFFRIEKDKRFLDEAQNFKSPAIMREATTLRQLKHILRTEENRLRKMNSKSRYDYFIWFAEKRLFREDLEDIISMIDQFLDAKKRADDHYIDMERMQRRLKTSHLDFQSEGFGDGYDSEDQRATESGSGSGSAWHERQGNNGYEMVVQRNSINRYDDRRNEEYNLEWHRADSSNFDWSGNHRAQGNPASDYDSYSDYGG